MQINRSFDGKMNLDTHPFRVPPSDYSNALNITRDSKGSGQDRVVTNLPGNQLVSYSLPSGTNRRIGSKDDLIKNRVYYYIWNSNGNNLILYYDRTLNTITKLLEDLTDTNNVPILAFDPSYRINHIDIIYKDDGDLLFWTDGLNRPFYLNVTEAENDIYGSNWLLEYITVNRPMPLIAPICDYADDNTVNVNNLRKKLYQFKYRFVYTNFFKSCWSPISKLFAPADPDSIATDIDPTKNNRIDVTVQTGNQDVLKIEIAARQSIDTTFSDFFLVTTLNKSDLSIPSNSTTIFQFFNDSSYPYIDINESLLLYSFVPQRAYTQCLPNGNVLAYAAITEDYTFGETLNVTSSITTIDNSTNLSLSISVTNGTYTPDDHPNFDTGGLIYTLSGGTTGVVSVTLNFTASPVGGDVSNSVTYILNPGDTLQDIINGLFALFPVTNFNAIKTSTVEVTLPPLSLMVFEDHAGSTGYVPISGSFTIATSSSGVTDINISCYKHRARYSWGLVYFDQFGETDGVQYQSSSMSLLMPELDTTGGTAPKIPQITFNIFHQPPIWAKYFAWVRTTNLTFLSSVATVSFTTEKDTTAGFAYLQITNLQTNQNGYSAYEFTQGDRVRIIGGFTNNAAGTVNEHDFPIVDLLTNPKINNVVTQGDWLKVPYDTVLSAFGTSGNNNYYIEIYTPAPNTNTTQQVFYEFGENYPVIFPGTANRAHGGQQQDQQIGVQPAIFNFIRGDYYERKRTYFIDATTPVITWVLSQSVSDQYPSQVQSIGRAFVIVPDAKQTYFPTLIRFGLEYQQDTNVNKTNLFFPDNLDEYDRSNGDIRKLFIEGRYLYVFQKFDIGVVPVLTQVVTDTAANPLQAQSDVLLNKIIYPYKGKYGIGDCPESFAYYNYAKYGFDNNKGEVWRLSQDGITPLASLYECHAFFASNGVAYQQNLNNGLSANGQPYTGNPTVYGAFDFFTNRYIIALEEISRYKYVIDAPTSTPTAILQAGGSLSFQTTFKYKISYGNAGGSESPLSDASNQVTIDLSNKTVHLTNIPISTDGTVTKRFIYVYSVADAEYRLLDVINDNSTTTYTESADTDLGGTNTPTTELTFHQDPYTLTFAETRDTTEGFESFISYYPEGMVCLGVLLISFKNGELWTHDSDTYCSFFGQQFDASITGVFNENALEKKTWQSLTELSDTVWECPTITTNTMSYGSTPQLSKLITQNFTVLEGMPSTAFLRDQNSRGNWINGDFLKGNYIIIKFLKQNASTLIYLNGVSVFYKDSPLTTKI